jgi:hypothetical protein
MLIRHVKTFSWNSHARCIKINKLYIIAIHDFFSSTVGAAIGGGISLIAIIVGLVILYRICKRRRASQGTTFTTGPPITTVMNCKLE